MHNLTNLLIFPTKRVLEDQTFAESVIVSLSSTKHNKIHKFNINFFVLHCLYLCVILFLFVMYFFLQVSCFKVEFD